MKYIFYILLSVIIFSCSSDNQTSETELSNTLIIKHIKYTEDGNEREFYFDSNGKLDSITDTNALPEYNYILSKFMYANDDKLVSSYHTYGTEEISSTLEYSNNNISNYSYSTLGSGTNSEVSINNNNIVNYTDEIDYDIEQQNVDIELTFGLDDLKYLTQKKYTLENAPTSILNLTNYEYDDNFNLMSNHTTIFAGTPANFINTYLYDDKKNPIAESMADYNFALYFLDELKLVNMSPNNVISKTNTQGATQTYDYIYNNDNYPVSAIITNTATNEILSSVNYTYY